MADYFIRAVLDQASLQRVKTQLSSLADAGAVGLNSQGVNSFAQSANQATRANQQLGQSMQYNERVSRNFGQSMIAGQVGMREFGQQTAIVGGRLAVWTAAGIAIGATIDVIRDVSTATLDANEALTNMQRVITSGFDRERLARTMANDVRELHVSTKDAGHAAFEMGKIYHNQAEALAAARTALIGVKVAELDAVQAARDLPKVAQAFGLSGFELEGVLDKLNKQQNTLGVGIPKTLESVARAAAITRAANGSLDNLVARSAVGIRFTGFNPETVSRAQGRLAQQLLDPKGQATIRKALDSIGAEDIQLLNPDKTLRSIDAILEDIGSRFDQFSGTQKDTIAKALAGGRQGQLSVIVTTLLSQWKKVQEQIDASSDSQGSAGQELAIVMRAAREHIKGVGSEFQRMGIALESSGVLSSVAILALTMKNVLEVTNNVIETINDLDPNGFVTAALSMGLMVKAGATLASIFQRNDMSSMLGMGGAAARKTKDVPLPLQDNVAHSAAFSRIGLPAAVVAPIAAVAQPKTPFRTFAPGRDPTGPLDPFAKAIIGTTPAITEAGAATAKLTTSVRATDAALATMQPQIHRFGARRGLAHHPSLPATFAGGLGARQGADIANLKPQQIAPSSNAFSAAAGAGMIRPIDKALGNGGKFGATAGAAISRSLKVAFSPGGVIAGALAATFISGAIGDKHNTAQAGVQGAATGALAGMIFGPIGVGIGAAIGGLTNALIENKRAAEEANAVIQNLIRTLPNPKAPPAPGEVAQSIFPGSGPFVPDPSLAKENAQEIKQNTFDVLLEGISNAPRPTRNSKNDAAVEKLKRERQAIIDAGAQRASASDVQRVPFIDKEISRLEQGKRRGDEKGLALFDTFKVFTEGARSDISTLEKWDDAKSVAVKSVNTLAGALDASSKENIDSFTVLIPSLEVFFPADRIEQARAALAEGKNGGARQMAEELRSLTPQIESFGGDLRLVVAQINNAGRSFEEIKAREALTILKRAEENFKTGVGSLKDVVSAREGVATAIGGVGEFNQARAAAGNISLAQATTKTNNSLDKIVAWARSMGVQFGVISGMAAKQQNIADILDSASIDASFADDLARAEGDPVATASVERKRLEAQISALEAIPKKSRTKDQKNDLLTKQAGRISNDKTMIDATDGILAARDQYFETLVADDPIAAAGAQLNSAQNALGRANTQSERYSAMGDLVSAQNAQRDAIFEKQRSDIDFAHDMDKISDQLYITKLKGLVKFTKKGSQQRKDLLVEIHNLGKEGADETFGLPTDFGLPSFFEVGRAVSTGIKGSKSAINRPRGQGPTSNRSTINNNRINIVVQDKRHLKQVEKIVRDATGAERGVRSAGQTPGLVM